ncbi:hypothetical protein FRC17_009073 [Serendipita sp. 399]|nr:hypothetical protein FRC17_009073 [Serendipita sp. 399]
MSDDFNNDTAVALQSISDSFQAMQPWVPTLDPSSQAGQLSSEMSEQTATFYTNLGHSAIVAKQAYLCVTDTRDIFQGFLDGDVSEVEFKAEIVTVRSEVAALKKAIEPVKGNVQQQINETVAASLVVGGASVALVALVPVAAIPIFVGNTLVQSAICADMKSAAFLWSFHPI